MKKIITLFVALFFFSCDNPMSKEFNKDRFSLDLIEIRESRGAEISDIIATYVMQQTLRGLLEENANNPLLGKSYNEILDQANEFAAEIKMLQVWDQEECKKCRDPWMDYSRLSEITNLKGELDKWGEESSVSVDGWVLFKNVKLIIPPAGKDFADLKIEFKYNSSNCWELLGGPIRESHIRIGPKTYWKNEDFLYNASDGQKFDIMMKDPLFDSRGFPSDACDFWWMSFESDDVMITPSLSPQHSHHEPMDDVENNDSYPYSIKDPDGYSNLRSAPFGDVVRKVFENEIFRVEDTLNNHCRVIFPDLTGGFIHISRVIQWTHTPE